jgi:hypothetical protein
MMPYHPHHRLRRGGVLHEDPNDLSVAGDTSNAAKPDKDTRAIAINSAQEHKFASNKVRTFDVRGADLRFLCS